MHLPREVIMLFYLMNAPIALCSSTANTNCNFGPFRQPVPEAALQP